MKKIFLIVFILMISLLASGSSFGSLDNIQNIERNYMIIESSVNDLQQTTTSNPDKLTFLNIFENVKVSTEKITDNHITSSKIQKTSKLNLSDKILSSDLRSPLNVVVLIKHQPQMIMERITNYVNVKSIKNKSPLSIESLLDTLYIQNWKFDFGNELNIFGNDNHLLTDFNIVPDISAINNIIDSLIIPESLHRTAIIQPDDFQNYISSSVHNVVQVFDIKNPTLLLLLVPVAGFILFRSDNEKFSFTDIKPILSFCFIIILISLHILQTNYMVLRQSLLFTLIYFGQDLLFWSLFSDQIS